MEQIAVLGAGYWGKNLIRNFNQLGILASVCETDKERLEWLGKEYPDIDLTDDFGEVLNNEKIQGVAIALPAVHHYQFAKRVLEAGRDVFVEKPLALKVEEARDLIDLAGEKQKILMVGHLLQYHPAFIKLKSLVEGGQLGRIQYIYSNRLNLGKIRREENALWSFAPHDISMILSLAKEKPHEVNAVGGYYLHESIADVTTTHMSFPSGIRAHIFVSWLHPFKEQKLVVVAEKKMAVFEDTQPWEKKIALYPHSLDWKMGMPVSVKAEPAYVEIEPLEPLKSECRHFLDCMKSRSNPLTDGEEGYNVLEVLELAQQSLSLRAPVKSAGKAELREQEYFIHQSAFVDKPCRIGKGTKIWHFTHILKNANIGANCILGQNVSIANDVTIGNNVKIQNNVSVYTGTVIEDDVFLGPSCVLTNVNNPRSQVNRHSLYEKTLIKRGATVCANATIVCGTAIGRYAFIAAGAVVTRDVADYAFIKGVPGRQEGWMSRHGHKLTLPNKEGMLICPESGLRYKVQEGKLRCMDLGEDEPLPEEMRRGNLPYRESKIEE
ncbi:Gfo/Idh/MocA family oxidoreductase [Fibrobacterota bacterium]